MSAYAGLVHRWGFDQIAFRDNSVDHAFNVNWQKVADYIQGRTPADGLCSDGAQTWDSEGLVGQNSIVTGINFPGCPHGTGIRQDLSGANPNAVFPALGIGSQINCYIPSGWDTPLGGIGFGQGPCTFVIWATNDGSYPWVFQSTDGPYDSIQQLAGDMNSVGGYNVGFNIVTAPADGSAVYLDTDPGAAFVGIQLVMAESLPASGESWGCLIFTYDGTTFRSYYAEAGSRKLLAVDSKAGAFYRSGNQLWFGALNTAQGSYTPYHSPWNGSWAAPMLWDRALSYETLQRLWTLGCTPTYSLVKALHRGKRVVKPAPNDNFARAQEIFGKSGSTIPIDVAGLTTETSEPSTADMFALTQTCWFKWTAPANGNVGFNTSKSTAADKFSESPGTSGALWSTLSVYTGSDFASLSAVASTSDAATQNAVFTAEAGTTYYIQVGTGDQGFNGELVLSWGHVDVPVGTGGSSGGSGTSTGSNPGVDTWLTNFWNDPHVAATDYLSGAIHTPSIIWQWGANKRKTAAAWSWPSGSWTAIDFPDPSAGQAIGGSSPAQYWDLPDQNSLPIPWEQPAYWGPNNTIPTGYTATFPHWIVTDSSGNTWDTGYLDPSTWLTSGWGGYDPAASGTNLGPATAPWGAIESPASGNYGARVYDDSDGFKTWWEGIYYIGGYVQMASDDYTDSGGTQHSGFHFNRHPTKHFEIRLRETTTNTVIATVSQTGQDISYFISGEWSVGIPNTYLGNTFVGWQTFAHITAGKRFVVEAYQDSGKTLSGYLNAVFSLRSVSPYNVLPRGYSAPDPSQYITAPGVSSLPTIP